MQHARPDSTTNGDNILVQLIVFRAGNEEFGVPIDSVREIIKKSMITPIPNSPDFIKGIVNVRGEIVTAIDVKARFALTYTKNIEPKHIIVTNQEDSLYGLLVDEVIEVLRVPKKEIKAPPNLVSKVHEKYVSAVISHENRLIILLDLSKMLSQKDLVNLSTLVKKHNKPGKKMLISKNEGSDKDENLNRR